MAVQVVNVEVLGLYAPIQARCGDLARNVVQQARFILAYSIRLSLSKSLPNVINIGQSIWFEGVRKIEEFRFDKAMIKPIGIDWSTLFDVSPPRYRMEL
ncbi:MAG: hypothetical protein AAFO07_31975 [Bacteroidota bacterium]